MFVLTLFGWLLQASLRVVLDCLVIACRFCVDYIDIATCLLV